MQGAWRNEIDDHHGHRLSVRRTAPGLYRAYLDGRVLGIWRSKEMAMAATEWAAIAQKARKPAASSRQRSAEIVPRRKRTA
jgi:hypothetical protein